MNSIKDYIKGEVIYQYYHDGSLWYKTENGFEFPVDIKELGTAKLYPKDKAMLYMKYIKRWLTVIEKGQQNGSEE